MARPFLTAAWRHLLMLNFEVDRRILEPLLPRGLEIDLDPSGRALVSLVGFRFLDTRVRGFAIPGHRNFDEVNLRFYVLRRLPDGSVRRGVTFVRELVPRLAIALVARFVYDEPYRAAPMRSRIDLEASSPSVAYAFADGGRWHELRGRPVGESILATDDPNCAFITEHYFGYTKRRSGATSEYEVKHPVWRLRRVEDAEFSGDAIAVYGREFGTAIGQGPLSAFVADGSDVEVHPGANLPR